MVTEYMIRKVSAMLFERYSYNTLSKMVPSNVYGDSSIEDRITMMLSTLPSHKLDKLHDNLLRKMHKLPGRVSDNKYSKCMNYIYTNLHTFRKYLLVTPFDKNLSTKLDVAWYKGTVSKTAYTSLKTKISEMKSHILAVVDAAIASGTYREKNSGVERKLDDRDGGLFEFTYEILHEIHELESQLLSLSLGKLSDADVRELVEYCKSFKKDSCNLPCNATLIGCRYTK